MTIVEFLLARYDEDEAELNRSLPEGVKRLIGDSPRWFKAPRPWADLDAKRLIVEEHATVGGRNPECVTCDGGGGFGAPWPCSTLRALASVYVDHPDYDEGWRL